MMDIVIFIVVLGLIFDYTNGFHDAANVVSTVIATRVLRPAVAVMMAGVFNMLGATQISGVVDTITTGIIDIKQTTALLVVSALGGAIFWNLLTWYFGIPSSSSYALIGGLLGASFMQAKGASILWSGVIYKVLIPMILSPLLGFFLALFFMKWLLHFTKDGNQKIFKQLQVVSAAFVALSHGLNDAQKSMGIITLGLFTAKLIPNTEVPLWVIGACGAVIGLGTASGGFRIIRTVGYQITQLKPIQGFAVESCACLVILLASFLGMPVSSTQMIVGSVAGVGAAKGFHSVQWGLAKKLVGAWFLTIPGSGFISFCLLKLLLRLL